MLRLFHGSKTSISLLILIFIFVLLVTLIVGFSQQILVNLANLDLQANLVIYLVAIALPLILLGVTVYQLTKTGAALEAMVSGTKYWKDPELN